MSPGDRYETWVDSEAYRRERVEKARVIHRLCGPELAAADRIVDLGAGTGIVKNELEKITGKDIVGIELDVSFIELADGMVAADVTRLPLEDESVDFALLNHLYEHVADQAGLFHELDRVLKPGAGAYVAAGNRLAVMEPHYRLPFLSWLPGPLADAYLRLTGRGESYRDIRFRTRSGLEARIRTAGLRVDDRTRRALDQLIGEAWGVGWERLWRAISALPDLLVDSALRRLSPQWFLLVRKPRDRTGAERPGRGGLLRTRRRSTGRSTRGRGRGRGR